MGVSGWIAENWLRVVLAVTSSATLGVAVQFYRIWRSARSADRKLDVDEADGIRDHYAAELAALRAQIVTSGTAHAERAREAEERYRAGLRAADERHDAAMRAADEREAQCQENVRELRSEVRHLSDEIIGLRRQLGQSSKSAIVLATHAPTETIKASAERAATALDELEARAHEHEREPHGDG
jgi:chromosome segregation ATPase